MLYWYSRGHGFEPCSSVNFFFLRLFFLYCLSWVHNCDDLSLLCSSRKYPYSPHGRDWKFLGGGGFPKTKRLKEMSEVQLKFPEGWGGSYKKSPPWGRYGYFMELHILKFKYMNFIYLLHIFSMNGYGILQTHKWPAPSWLSLVTQLVRALHRYRRGHGFQPLSSLNFFSGCIFSTAYKLSTLLWWSIICLQCYCAVEIYEFHIEIIHFISSPSRGINYKLTGDQLPVSLIAQLVGALHE